jgi:hypothetical protein
MFLDAAEEVQNNNPGLTLIHDAKISPIDRVGTDAKNYNEHFYDVLANYNPLNELYNNINSIIERLANSEYPAAGFKLKSGKSETSIFEIRDQIKAILDVVDSNRNIIHKMNVKVTNLVAPGGTYEHTVSGSVKEETPEDPTVTKAESENSAVSKDIMIDPTYDQADKQYDIIELKKNAELYKDSPVYDEATYKRLMKLIDEISKIKQNKYTEC